MNAPGSRHPTCGRLWNNTAALIGAERVIHTDGEIYAGFSMYLRRISLECNPDAIEVMTGLAYFFIRRFESHPFA